MKNYFNLNKIAQMEDEGPSGYYHHDDIIELPTLEFTLTVTNVDADPMSDHSVFNAVYQKTNSAAQTASAIVGEPVHFDFSGNDIERQGQTNNYIVYAQFICQKNSHACEKLQNSQIFNQIYHALRSQGIDIEPNYGFENPGNSINQIPGDVRARDSF